MVVAPEAMVMTMAVVATMAEALPLTKPERIEEFKN
jgi:hypothetical protein